MISLRFADRCITAHSPFLVGTEGCGGAGKSYLAQALRSCIESQGKRVAVVHMDDFFLPAATRTQQGAGDIGSAFSWMRLRNQVLAPLRVGESVRYQRYDWPTDTLAEWHELTLGIVIIEGIYVTRVELAHFYDLTIWVECRRELRLARGLARDGENARQRWEKEWMPAEDVYVDTQSPQTRADIIYDGSGAPRSC